MTERKNKSLLFLTHAAVMMKNEKKAKVNTFFSVFAVRCGTLSNASLSVYSIEMNEERGSVHNLCTFHT